MLQDLMSLPTIGNLVKIFCFCFKEEYTFFVFKIHKKIRLD